MSRGRERCFREMEGVVLMGAEGAAGRGRRGMLF